MSVNVEISKADAEEFFSAVAAVLKPLDVEQLDAVYLTARAGIPISFSNEWVPFLGHTRGWNNPDRLLYERLILSPTRVLDQVAVWLRVYGRERPGGRVFLNEFGAKCDGENIGHWIWFGEDPKERIKKMVRGLRRQRSRGRNVSVPCGRGKTKLIRRKSQNAW